MNESGITGTHLVLAFLGGAAAGAGLALLTAPRTGQETRERIIEYAKEGQERSARVPKAIKEASGAAKEAFNESLHKQGAS